MSVVKFQFNHKVDFYFEKAKKWRAEIETLRTIILATGLAEELKWGCPSYTYEDRNVALIHVFKEYCAILFFKGARLKDPKSVLVQQTKNVQAARQLRFTHLEEIVNQKSIITSYIKEAIKIEKSGAKIELKKTNDFEMPEELQNRLNNNVRLKTAFYSLTPGRQRAYLLYFTGAKQAATREARIQKYEAQILAGKGLND